ncbi:MAG: PHP domain-containing protein [Treponema sp.]|nr:PHP domain-containing protein [Treponema sp.]
MKLFPSFISAYSFLCGVHRCETLLDRAAAEGAETAAITDLNGLYGVHSFIEAAKERGIRPIIGAILSPRYEAQDSALHREQGIYCYVQNRRGFSRLCEILSSRNKKGSDWGMEKLCSLLKEDSEGLVLASADQGILRDLKGQVGHLYAAIDPSSLGGLGARRSLGLPLALLHPVIFLDKEDHSVHRLMRAIGLNKTLGTLAPADCLGEAEGLYKSPQELQGRLRSWPEAEQGAAEIADLCRFDNLFEGFIFPSYGEDPSGELRRRCYEGAARRYGELGDCEINRIEEELHTIDSMGFSPYFLRIHDIVHMAPGNRTCGRGSGAASIVSYSLGITNVDPIRHNLYFERFLNLARPDPPDIDIDFAWDERDDLIKGVIARFGSDYCARVANHNFFRRRSALRETAKAHGYADGEITQGKAGEEILTLARRIEGLPRGLSMHCGGLVITPDKISRYAPIEESAGPPDQSYPLLSWEKEGTEAAGFVKIDLLGNRSLAVIRDTLKDLRDQGITIDETTWLPQEDKQTIAALARGDTMGVFYIESPAMRQLQRKTRVGDFEHIVIHSSIIRPAANKFINEYVRRLKGGAWESLHPRLDHILGESYGILCYQEDVSKTAIALADFNEADADKLRKVIAKKAGGARLRVYETQFFEGCRQNGVPEETIQKVWTMMLSFDGYSFCKPHSASYAMVSYQAAYLRTHHGPQFMAGVLSNQGGFYRPHAYISEARRMGIETQGPDVNRSRWHYYGQSDRPALVIGLMAVKGVSAGGVRALLDERERGGPYSSLEDLGRRIALGRDDITALAPAGVFDSIAGGLSRPLQARRLLGMSSMKLESSRGELFPQLEAREREAPYSPGGHETLLREYQALGFLRKQHPLVLWKEAVQAQRDRVKGADLQKHLGRRISMVGWPVTQKEVWTKDGLTMSFLSLEDETALYETVIFPEIYDRYSKLLFEQRPLLIQGRVMDDQGALSLELSRIQALA